MANERRCKARDASGFWWGADEIDPSEPGFVAGKGIFFPETVPCVYVPLPDEDLCYRHSFIVKNQKRSLADDRSSQEVAEDALLRGDAHL